MKVQPISSKPQQHVCETHHMTAERNKPGYRSYTSTHRPIRSSIPQRSPLTACWKNSILQSAVNFQKMACALNAIVRPFDFLRYINQTSKCNYQGVHQREWLVLALFQIEPTRNRIDQTLHRYTRSSSAYPLIIRPPTPAPMVGLVVVNG